MGQRKRTKTSSRQYTTQDKTILKAMGQRIRVARQRRGLTQGRVAEAIGVDSAEAVSSYERGLRVPRPEHLLRLARCLDMSLDGLFALDEGTVPHARIIKQPPDAAYPVEFTKLDLANLRTTRHAAGLFSSLGTLPEIRRTLLRHEHPKEWLDKNESADLARMVARMEEWKKYKWHALTLLAWDAILAFAAGFGRYQVLSRQLRVRQLEHVLGLMAKYPSIFHVRVNRREGRTGWITYDESLAILKTTRRRLYLTDAFAVQSLVQEFEELWGQSEDARGHLEQLISQTDRS